MSLPIVMSSFSGIFHYRAFGLNIQSILPFIELASGGGEPDVTVGLGQVPESLDDALDKGVCYQASPTRFLLRIDGIANFLVQNGKEIVVECMPGAADDAVRLFLLGSAMGVLLHQRGMLPLHGSTVATPKGAVLFIGPAGYGKSTLAAAFAHRGYSILADDVCVFSPGETPLVIPAYPQLKLWADAVEKLGRDPGTLRRVRPELEKHGWPLQKEFCDQPLPPHRIYVLSIANTSKPELVPLKGMEKLSALIENTFRVRILEGLDGRERHFKQCAALANQIKMCRLIRPEGDFRLDELVDLLEKDFT